MSEGGLGEVVSKSFDEFTLFGLSGFPEELAEVKIVERLMDVVGIGSFLQIRNGNRDGAEKFLRMGTFAIRHPDATREFQINKGKSGGHG